MTALLAPYRDLLDVQFIDAVNGRAMSEDELDKVWDQTGTFEIYGRTMKPTEIGCALSHRKCYEKLLESREKIALVLEDDLVWTEKDLKPILSTLQEFLNTEEPVIVLLSGDYWFANTKKVGDVCLATVREAVCAHAYLINRNAAKILISLERKYIADDWYNLKKHGIKLYGIYPHIADQNRKDFNTEISPAYEGVIRRNLSFLAMMHSYYRAVVKRMLCYTGHFESKTFVY